MINRRALLAGAAAAPIAAIAKAPAASKPTFEPFSAYSKDLVVTDLTYSYSGPNRFEVASLMKQMKDAGFEIYSVSDSVIELEDRQPLAPANLPEGMTAEKLSEMMAAIDDWEYEPDSQADLAIRLWEIARR